MHQLLSSAIVWSVGSSKRTSWSSLKMIKSSMMHQCHEPMLISVGAKYSNIECCSPFLFFLVLSLMKNIFWCFNVVWNMKFFIILCSVEDNRFGSCSSKLKTSQKMISASTVRYFFLNGTILWDNGSGFRSSLCLYLTIFAYINVWSLGDDVAVDSSFFFLFDSVIAIILTFLFFFDLIGFIVYLF